MKHLLLLHKVKFYKRLYLRSDLVHNLFWVSLMSRPNGIYDECMTTVLVHCTLPWIMYIHSFMNMLTVVCSLCLCVLFSPYISVFYSSFQAAIFNKFELRSVVFFVVSSASIFSANKHCILDVLIATLKPHSNGPL